MTRTRCGLLSLLGLLLFAACSHPPRVTTEWASDAREVFSPDLPKGEPQVPEARYGLADARDVCELTDLDGEEQLGEVVVELGEGVYVLDAPVLLQHAESLVLRGQGTYRTRLELSTDTKGSLMLQGPNRVELRDLTLVGYTGGGIRIKGCPEVVVENVHFAGLRLGLDLEASTARVGSSVFAGCQQALVADGGELHVDSSAFLDCWVGIDGRSAVDVTSCAFVDNRDAIKARLDGRSRITGCLFAGEKQDLAWSGRPASAAWNLVHESEIGKRVGGKTNKPIVHEEEFPDSLRGGLPQGMDLVAVHLALQRGRLRGKKEQALRDFQMDRALAFADACKHAALRNELGRARAAARIALRYLGGIPLEDAPTQIKEIAALAN